MFANLGRVGARSAVDPLPSKVKRILSKFGSDAHLYLPGIGMVSGFVAGNYFDSAGTTHASIDGSVGLVLDAAGSVGPELVTNGDFSNGTTGWNFDPGWNATGGAATKVGAAGANIVKPALIELNKTYRVTYTITRTAGAIFPYCGNHYGTPHSQAGTYTQHLKSTSGTDFGFAADGGFLGTVDNISVKEITGIHATQSTPGYKPTLRKGIVNRVNGSHNVVGWQLSNGATRSGNVISFPNEYALVAVGQNQAITSGPATIAFKLSGSGTCKILQDTSGAGGAVAVASVMLTAEPTIYVGTFTATNDFSAILSRWGGDTATSVTAECVGIFAGTLTAQQIIAAGGIPLTTTAPASSQAGVNYLEFDGVDDRLNLGGPLFQMADDHCVVAGFNTSTIGAVVVAPGAVSSGDKRICYLRTEGGTGKARVEWYDGVTHESVTSAAPILNQPVVLAGRKLGSTGSGWLNSTSLGTVNLTTAPVATKAAIGELVNGANAFTKGTVSGVIFIKGAVGDSDLLVLRKFIGSLSGVTL